MSDTIKLGARHNGLYVQVGGKPIAIVRLANHWTAVWTT